MKVIVKKTRFGFRTIEKPKEDYIIYCLYCPIEKSIKYIGRTNQGLRQRLSGHINEAFAQQSLRAKWLNRVIKKHKAVYARVLMECNGELNAKKLESELIERISEKRYLVNSGNDGKGYGLTRNSKRR